MTLPPEKQPLRDFARDGQINWRQATLYDTRRALFWRRRLRRVTGAVTSRLWREVAGGFVRRVFQETPGRKRSTG